ncbi:MAG TPA: hypothetical protein PKA00_14995 [Saprospiraceae bacterium]|nr:hypothetical protein [Saprospiraceae bacterium]HMQ84219.1 hypothetical protein [Saprospiraceae bacterium]
MKKQISTGIMLCLCFMILGCNEDPIINCPNLDSIQGEIEINGQRLPLQMAEVFNAEPPSLDAYEFLIDAIGNDCNEILKFRFYATVLKNEPLNGEFQIMESNVYTAHKITSFTYTVETIEPINFDIQAAISGTVLFTTHSESEYTMQVDAQLTDGKRVTMNFKHQF